MAEDSAQERTEEPTARRQQQAREKGQVARSRELNTTLVLLSAVSAGILIGPSIVKNLMELISSLFIINRDLIFNTNGSVERLATAITEALVIITPFFVVMVIAAVVGPLFMGGVNFSTKSIAFKFDKLDPIKGIKRVFAWRGFVELVKALAKFIIVGLVAMIYLFYYSGELIMLGTEPLFQGINHAVQIMLWSFLAMASALILVAAIDVPFQIWDHKQQIKMTRQEVKDDSKESEGNPEIRGQVRRLQREMAQRRMMEEIPKADVVITNPEHYSVALRYDQNSTRAPIVVAKGVDQIAMRIRFVARQHKVILLEAPPLARSIYHTTKLNEEIPTGLYLAVAQILAYVFNLKKSNKSTTSSTKAPDVPIPDDLRFDK